MNPATSPVSFGRARAGVLRSRGIDDASAKATLTVEQEKDGETRSGEILFVLENGEWKMTP